jgi:hypothetical protein
MDTAFLTWQIEQGAEGTDSEPNNPLARACNKLFIDGKPHDRLSLCFFGELKESETSCSSLKWLGVFVFSAGKRVLFFPGFGFDPEWIKIYYSHSKYKYYDFEIDHISLEKNLDRWHLTSQRTARHLGSGRTIPLDHGRVLWFGMSVVQENILREVKKETIVNSQMPSSDSKRRTEVFFKSREGAVFNCVCLAPIARTHFKEGFLHFAFIVGPKGFPHYRGNQFGIPISSPFLKNEIPDDAFVHLPIRTHRLSLCAQIDIQITTMWLPGSLTQPVTFTGPFGK